MELIYGMLGFGGSIAIAIYTLYNQLITSHRRAEQAIRDLSLQFDQRDQAAQTIIEVAKNYMTIDPAIAQKIEEARAKTTSSTSFDERAIAENQLSSILKSILAVLQANESVKNDQQFIFARQSLGDTEGLIQRARSQYMSDGGTYNSIVTSFPSSIFARMFGYKPLTLFEYAPSVVPNMVMNSGMQPMMMQPMMQQPMMMPTQQPTQQNTGSFPGFPSI